MIYRSTPRHGRYRIHPPRIERRCPEAGRTGPFDRSPGRLPSPDGFLVSLYLIGFEDEPERAGEITLMEVFGHAVHEDGVVVGRGIRKIRDPALVDDFHETELPIRLSDRHVYALDWTADGVSFFVDGELVSRCTQSPDYPMQLMLNLYELPETEESGARAGDIVDACFEIDHVRAYTADL